MSLLGSRVVNTVRFQHYEVLRKEDGSLCELGHGAMGITYKAFDTNLRCHVALKVIKSAYLNSETARERFLREARAAAAIRHPNVATVFHLGREGEDYFYAMEFVGGETVEAFIKREGAVPQVTALKVAAQVARALSAAEKQGLVHRDIKPSNIMFTHEDGGDIAVKVIDFGLAKSAGTTEESATLTAGGFVGTPHFASPEQLEEGEIDVRSDIYSLGVTLWYMLAGKTPFSGSTVQVMSQHLHRDPPFEKLQRQPIPVLRLLRRMIAKKSVDRVQTPVELRRAIEDCLEQIEESALPEEKIEESARSAEVNSVESGRISHELPDSSSLAAGMILAGGYRLLKEISASDHGRMFRAEHIDNNSAVAALILQPALPSRSKEFIRLEQEVNSLRQLKASAFQQILAVECTEAQTFLILEWIEGPSLLDLLRSRRAFPLSEAKLLLFPLSEAFDELRSAGLGCPDIAAHEILLPGADAEKPVKAWGVCQPKFLPLMTAASRVIPPEATMVASSFALMQKKGAFARSPSTAYLYAVASLAYEMLGGVKASGPMDTYVPIPGLSEKGNAVLRRALTPGQHYENASAFTKDLADEVPSAPRSTPASTPQWAAPIVLPKRRSVPKKWLTAAILLLIIGGVAVWQGVRSTERLPFAQTSQPDFTPAPPSPSTPEPAWRALHEQDQEFLTQTTPSQEGTKEEEQISEPTSTPEPTSMTPEPTSIDQIRDFVSAFVVAGISEDVGAELQFFAEKADYYDSGTVSKAFIRKDILRYNQKWPVRRYWLDGEIRVLSEMEADPIEVRYQIRYAVRNQRRESSGKAVKTLKLRKTQNGLAITSVREKTLN